MTFGRLFNGFVVYVLQHMQLAALRAVEDAIGITIPKMQNYSVISCIVVLDVHDHIVHFYHLHALD